MIKPLDYSCPVCRRAQGADIPLTDRTAVIKPGDVTVCAGCAAVLTVRLDMTYAPLPDAERAALPPLMISQIGQAVKTSVSTSR